MNAYESSGKTVEEAISEGLNHLGMSIGDVDVEILDEGSKGLFGLFGSKMARVRLTVKESEEHADARDVFAGSLDSYTASSKREEATRQPRPARQPKPVRPRAQAKPSEEDEPAPKKAPRARAQRQPKPAAERREARPQEPATPPTPAEQLDPQTPQGKVQAFLQKLTGLMNVPVSVHVLVDEEGSIRVRMEGDAQGILIGRRGETLDALQYLASLYLNRGQEDYTRVTLDSEGYRAKREDALVRLANRMANRAQKTGRRVSLEPMNPYERRILHSALQNHPGITTHSEGEEPNRHVVITLSKDDSGESAAQEDE